MRVANSVISFNPKMCKVAIWKVEKWFPFLKGSDWHPFGFVRTRRGETHLYNEFVIQKNFMDMHESDGLAHENTRLGST